MGDWAGTGFTVNVHPWVSLYVTPAGGLVAKCLRCGASLTNRPPHEAGETATERMNEAAAGAERVRVFDDYHGLCLGRIA